MVTIQLLISLFIGCLSIGILLSAPMGPIGILCVQRTLNNGRTSGFYTGVGAAISDLVYCMLTGLGLSIVTSWIEDNFKILEIFGSALLIAYALYMILHKPQPHIDTKEFERKRMERYEQLEGVTGFQAWLKNAVFDTKDWLNHHERVNDIMTGFLLTLSNPFIIFLTIPMMARFEFPAPFHQWYHIVLGFIFIVLGALLWWNCITYLVDKVRTRFKIESMWTINKVMGTILLIVAAYGMYDGIHEFINQLDILPHLPTIAGR